MQNNLLIIQFYFKPQYVFVIWIFKYERVSLPFGLSFNFVSESGNQDHGLDALGAVAVRSLILHVSCVMSGISHEEVVVCFSF